MKLLHEYEIVKRPRVVLWLSGLTRCQTKGDKSHKTNEEHAWFHKCAVENGYYWRKLSGKLFATVMTLISKGQRGM